MYTQETDYPHLQSNITTRKRSIFELGIEIGNEQNHLLSNFLTGNMNINVSILLSFISFYSSNGGNLGDVNISALLTSFQTGYDKRVRPNYGGKKYMFELRFLIILMEFLSLTK